MTRISLPETAHYIIREHLYDGGIAIDATLGNGHDTVFLAECAGKQGRVFGFDVQVEAIDATQNRLQQHGLQERVKLIHASHAEMQRNVPQVFHGRIQAIMFNLGYLPGADKSVITKVGSTLTAVDAACDLLAEQGVITVLAYPGHAGGDEETRCLEQWCLQLKSETFATEVIFSSHPQASAPRLFVIRKVA
jgi:tRNA G37 N-methylase Trm5